MEVISKNKNLCITSLPGVFLSVVLSKSRCVFTTRPSSSSNSFFMFFIPSAFLLCSFSFHINSKIVLFLLHPVADFSSRHLHQIVGTNVFRYFFFFVVFVLIVPVSFKYPFSHQYILIYFFLLYCQTCLRLSFKNLFLCLDPYAFYLLLQFR